MGDETEKEKTIKIVVVGDGAIGKTSLLNAYTRDVFTNEYVVTIFDNYTVKVPIGDDLYTLNLYDTPGQDDYASFRPMVFPGTEVFVVCFSLVDPTSFQNIESKWMVEI